MPARSWLLAVAAVSVVAGSLSDRAAGDDTPQLEPAPLTRFHVPKGFVVERVAAPPLVRYPLFAAFDDCGRLYVAEGTGTNLPGEDLVKIQGGRILRLVDRDGDGVFVVSTVFADGLVFPTGVLWHDGALYATSHPSLWRFKPASDSASITSAATSASPCGSGNPISSIPVCRNSRAWPLPRLTSR